MICKRLAALLVSAVVVLVAMPCACAEDNMFETFSWAGGIEDVFIPHSKPGFRRLEEYELTQHYEQWKADLDRAKTLGITKLRWGVPWYRVEPQKDKFDWSFTDQVINHMVDDLHIDPIIDLVHYGTPTWMTESFLDPSYPARAAVYARAFAQRYKDKVRYYTPTNEPGVAAEYGGMRGEWPPYLKGEEGYVKVLLPVTRGMQEVAKALRQTDPNAVLVAAEAMRYVTAADDNSKLAAKIEFYRDMLPWDLVSGKVDEEHPLYEWLSKNGAEDEKLKELRDNAQRQDVFGVNFYPWSIKVAKQDGNKVVLSDGPQRGRLLSKVLESTSGYTKMPLFVTETSSLGDVTTRALWMSETIDAVRIARAGGKKVLGYTWFPLLAMVDWQYRLTKKPMEDHLINPGLWDWKMDENGLLTRRQTRLVDDYRDWIQLGIKVP